MCTVSCDDVSRRVVDRSLAFCHSEACFRVVCINGHVVSTSHWHSLLLLLLLLVFRHVWPRCQQLGLRKWQRIINWEICERCHRSSRIFSGTKENRETFPVRILMYQPRSNQTPFYLQAISNAASGCCPVSQLLTVIVSQHILVLHLLWQPACHATF